MPRYKATVGHIAPPRGDRIEIGEFDAKTNEEALRVGHEAVRNLEADKAAQAEKGGTRSTPLGTLQVEKVAA